jgi:proteic killer suppression protein
MIKRVELKPSVRKTLRKIPKYLVVKFQTWVALVETKGLEETRRISGFHDEPLGADRKGQYSIRLNRAWRAFYTIEKDSSGEEVVQFVYVIEVNKHEY